MTAQETEDDSYVDSANDVDVSPSRNGVANFKFDIATNGSPSPKQLIETVHRHSYPSTRTFPVLQSLAIQFVSA